MKKGCIRRRAATAAVISGRHSGSRRKISDCLSTVGAISCAQEIQSADEQAVWDSHRQLPGSAIAGWLSL